MNFSRVMLPLIKMYIPEKTPDNNTERIASVNNERIMYRNVFISMP